MVWLELDTPKLGCELVTPKLGCELVTPKLGWMPSSDGQGVEAREATCELARDRSRCDEATSRSARRCAADKSCDRGHHVHSGRPSGWSLERQSAVISRHQPPSAVISRHQPSSAAISRHQPPSVVIKLPFQAARCVHAPQRADGASRASRAREIATPTPS